MDVLGHGLFISVILNDFDGLKDRLSAFGNNPIRDWKHREEIFTFIADPDRNHVDFERHSAN